MTLDRASIVDTNFEALVGQGKLPKPITPTSLQEGGMSPQLAIDIFDAQIKSRHLDVFARVLKEEGLGFYTIGSSGHEGNAVFGEVFPYTDMAFLHYRSGAFYLQRAKQLETVDGVKDVLLSLGASRDDPISGGRHKVFGSKQLNIPPQTSTIASHLPKALGAAISIVRAKELGFKGNLSSESVILCSFGDASLNHASCQATLNACSWLASQSYPLPLVFICEDNGLGISVPTPSHWVEQSVKARPNIHYISCDGLNIADCYQKARQAEQIARYKKQAVFLHMRCVRLLGHAGSDIESQYRTLRDIEQIEANDPLLHTAALLSEAGLLSLDEMVRLYRTNKELIQAKALEVLPAKQLDSVGAIKASIVPSKDTKHNKPFPKDLAREAVFGKDFSKLNEKRNLSQLINFALTDVLLAYPEALVFGEDVGKKGGVYRVTADLQKRFGARRVFDTLLDETTILGTAIGLAHNGFIPIPEIQFLAYLHNAGYQSGVFCLSKGVWWTFS